MTMATSTVTSPPRGGVSSRKTNKPLMEKRRRARINDSLLQLKTLVIQGNKKDSSQFNKLEKADILELTVKHLRNLQSQQQDPMNANGEHNGKYQAGFMECAQEVIRYLSQSQGFSDDIKTRVVQHLASCLQLSSKPSFVKPTAPSVPQSNSVPVITSSQPAPSAQIANGQIVHIVNAPYHQVKQGLSQYPANGATTVPSVTHQIPKAASPCVRITQPLHIQIPSVPSPVLVQPKVISQATQQKPAVHNLKQERVTSSTTTSPLQKEPSVSPVPLQLTKHVYYPHEDEYVSRSRTYSINSSSSETSEMTSPLNLSQSPQYYDSRRDSGYAHGRYPSPHHLDSYCSAPMAYSKDKFSIEMCPSPHQSSGYTSVIVDGRRVMMDATTFKYMSMVMEVDRHCHHQDESTSPASSVGEERLWRPW